MSKDLQVSAAAEIVDREAARTTALKAGRFDEVAAFYDERLKYTHSNGWRDDKQTLLARSTESGMRYEEIEHRIEQVQVQVIGDFAVATGTLRATVAMGEQRHEVDSQTSTAWSRPALGGPWTMVLFHSSPATQKGMP